MHSLTSLFLTLGLRIRARNKFSYIQPHLPPKSRVLDIGANDGFISELINKSGHYVVLADIMNLNRTNLPLFLYDGKTLPFTNNSFDITLLSYVLHHAKNPEQVLQEASRVARIVIVLESIVESERERRIITFLDRFLNRLCELAEHSDSCYSDYEKYHSPQEWQKIMTKLGLHILKFAWLSRSPYKHVIFVVGSNKM
ncbi:MAG: methyltransferase type 11 protein [Promethearchaeota archaeon CR_4]|nr:MAG: methyltransferase type 11 protein [Candidatus Lokiarchaeota archaeon CR_4]